MKIVFLLSTAALLGLLSAPEPAASPEAEMRKLPPPALAGKVSLEETLKLRRSVRNFSSEPLGEAEVGQLLWAAQGVTEAKRGLRTAPSAGATYPLETYILTTEGCFRYLPAEHALRLHLPGDLRLGLARAAYGQECVAQAPLLVVFTAVFERTTARYGERGTMYVHMEAGHAAQNLHLQAAALGLGSVPVGAFEEEAAAGALKLPPGEKPLYIIPVGRGAVRKLQLLAL